MGSPLSLLFSKIDKPKVLRWSSKDIPSSPFTSFIALLWTQSRTFTSSLKGGAQNATQYSGWGRTNAEHSSIITSCPAEWALLWPQQVMKVEKIGKFSWTTTWTQYTPLGIFHVLPICMYTALFYTFTWRVQWCSTGWMLSHVCLGMFSEATDQHLIHFLLVPKDVFCHISSMLKVLKIGFFFSSEWCLMQTDIFYKDHFWYK